ncbi:hypothetical protein KX816_07870 [Sphingosinicellaceae bacterium]|nr:hypothetical protein KX816_07870 [Sphingosinicellaceae bacterium]
MRRAPAAALLLLLGLAACDNAGPKAPTGNDAAIAAAERKAVSDTDAALAEARPVQPAPAAAQ